MRNLGGPHAADCVVGPRFEDTLQVIRQANNCSHVAVPRGSHVAVLRGSEAAMQLGSRSATSRPDDLHTLSCSYLPINQTLN